MQRVLGECKRGARGSERVQESARGVQEGCKGGAREVQECQRGARKECDRGARGFARGCKKVQGECKRMQEGCRKGARGLQGEGKRGARGMQEGCRKGARDCGNGTIFINTRQCLCTCFLEYNEHSVDLPGKPVLHWLLLLDNGQLLLTNVSIIAC